MKIDRLIGILSVLLQEEKTTAPELAERFEVSRRTINRDIEDLLNACIEDSREEAQNAPTPITNYALFNDGEYITNEQMNDKKFLKLVP